MTDVQKGRIPMYARVVTFQFQSGKLDEALQIARESILPEIRQRAGVQEITLLLDRSTNKMVAMSLWQTEADLQADMPNAPARLAKTSSLVAATPLVETYEVAEHVSTS
jgi:Antibiotic biosynthesis monooxygenase